MSDSVPLDRCAVEMDSLPDAKSIPRSFDSHNDWNVLEHFDPEVVVGLGTLSRIQPAGNA